MSDPSASTSGFIWRPIDDYPESPDNFALPELRELANVWLEQRGMLEKAEGLSSFNERLRREWSIETGLLERIYTLDRGVTQILIERGIDASLIPHGSTSQAPERVVAMIRDHEAAIDFIFDFVKGNRALSTSYIKELHSLLTRNQLSTSAVDSAGRVHDVELLRGAYKTLPNNPVRPNGEAHEYCPPEQVASEMDRMVDMHLSHDGTPPEVEAAWLHHRFTQIHPFQDGNGRVARCLATLVLVRAGWFPLVIRDLQDERLRYINALEQADVDDLAPLVKVIGSAQKRAFVQALGISGQVLRRARAELVVDAAVEELQAREKAKRAEWSRVRDVADAVLESASTRLNEVCTQLRSRTAQYFQQPEFFVDAEKPDGPRGHYFRWQIIQIAKQLHYFANVRDYHSWVRFVVKTGVQSEIVISIHGAGREFRGILGISAFFFNREESDQGDRTASELTPLSSEIFQLNYRESAQEAVPRSQDWLEEVLVQGLELWRNSV